MNRWLGWLLAIWIGLWGAGCAAPDSLGMTSGRVVRVVSGQTIEVQMETDPNPVTVRLLGLDAPDIQQAPWGEQATQFLHQWIEGQTVQLESDIEARDRFGRQLAYVWFEQQFVNEQIIVAGWALAVPRSPNLRYDDRLQHAQAIARTLQRGIWNPERPLRQSPSDFRRSQPQG
jgi:micrococcal nuclease